MFVTLALNRVLVPNHHGRPVYLSRYFKSAWENLFSICTIWCYKSRFTMKIIIFIHPLAKPFISLKPMYTVLWIELNLKMLFWSSVLHFLFKKIWQNQSIIRKSHTFHIMNFQTCPTRVPWSAGRIPATTSGTAWTSTAPPTAPSRPPSSGGTSTASRQTRR